MVTRVAIAGKSAEFPFLSICTSIGLNPRIPSFPSIDDGATKGSSTVLSSIFADAKCSETLMEMMFEIPKNLKTNISMGWV